MNDLLLINPALKPVRKRSADFVFPWGDGGHGWLPLGSLFLASYLEKHGLSVAILDMELFSSDDEEARLREYIRTARYIGLSVMTAQVPHALALTTQIKQMNPNAKIVWGGIHASLLPRH